MVAFRIDVFLSITEEKNLCLVQIAMVQQFIAYTLNHAQEGVSFILK